MAIEITGMETAVMSGRSTQGQWGGHQSYIAHKLPEDAGCVLSSETLCPRPERPSFCWFARQHSSSGLGYKPPGESVLALPLHTGAPDPLWAQGTPLAESSVYPYASQYGSRLPIETGAEARGMLTPP